jgi:nitrogen fixation-related uncharacterized protein
LRLPRLSADSLAMTKNANYVIARSLDFYRSDEAISVFKKLQIMILWFTFILVVSVPTIAILIWAIKNKQFKDQERARYLALNASIKEKE